MKISRSRVACGGIWCNVYGLENVHRDRNGDSLSAEVAMLFVLHGRFGSAEQIDPPIRTIFETVQSSRSKQSPCALLPLLITTFDQRNHGTRKISDIGQKAWDEGNAQHAQDMLAMLVGTAADTTFLADFLPSTLFPNEELTVKHWAVAGISLGGHAVWHVLQNDPRFRFGVPIIGCPAYRVLMMQRAEKSGLTLGPPSMPASLLTLLDRIDPDAKEYRSTDVAQNPYLGKRILAMHGGEDQLVPYSCCGTFEERLEVGKAGFKDIMVEPGKGHEVTKLMLSKLADFLITHVL